MDRFAFNQFDGDMFPDDDGGYVFYHEAKQRIEEIEKANDNALKLLEEEVNKKLQLQQRVEELRKALVYLAEMNLIVLCCGIMMLLIELLS